LNIAPVIDPVPGEMNKLGQPPACRMSRLFCEILGMLALAACATGSEVRDPPIQISGMVIENQTQMFVSAVRLLVPVTGRFVSCGNIAPGSMCSTTFPEAVYSGNPVEITWSQGGQIHSTGQFVLQVPADFDELKNGVVRVVISGTESAGASIVERQE
jgi:hypothetical protein